MGNQIWVRGVQIGEALEYKNPRDKINKLYQAHKDEFTASMTKLIGISDLHPQNGGAGQKREVRVFSLRGAHLLAMFARTEKAKAFRRWLLDILENLHLTAQRDTGNAKRKGSFYYDDNLPEHCQQLSRNSYRGKQLTGRYDRGHLVPANHMDSDPKAIRDSNYMTNIVPQAANANRGAWLLTEEIIECHRDKEELLVVGGVIWGNDPSDDYFLKTHGVRTPDALWKAVLKGLPGKEQVIAWVIPNTNDAKRGMLDRYLVSVAEIERITGQRINEIPASVKSVKPVRSWDVPKGCDKG